MNDKLNNIQIPEGWEEKYGYEIFQVQGGYAFKSDNYKDEGVLLVRIGNVGNGKFQYKDVVYVPKRFLKSHKNFLLNKGDVMMGLTGDLGKICILKSGDFPFILNQRVAKFNCNNFSNEYLNYLLSSQKIQNDFDALFAGGAQKNISPANIEGLKYLIPTSLSEQKKIAQILSTVDKAIEQTGQLIAKYQRIKTGLMQDLLTRGIDENGNIRSEETHEFKDSELGRIPKEWECVSTDSLCQEVVVGIVIKPTQYYVEFGVPMLRSLNVKEGKILMENLVYMKSTDNDKLDKSKLKENDVVSVRTGNPGTSSIITKDISGANCIDLVISRVNESVLNPDFLVFWINSALAKIQILNHQSGIAQQHFNVGDMKKLLIFKVGLDEQNKIIKILKKNDLLITNIKNKLQKLQRIKTALMQDLLSGKKRVNSIINGE